MPAVVCKHSVAKAKLTDAQLSLVPLQLFVNDEANIKFLFIQELEILDYKLFCEKLLQI